MKAKSDTLIYLYNNAKKQKMQRFLKMLQESFFSVKITIHVTGTIAIPYSVA